MNRQRNLHTRFKSDPSISFNFASINTTGVRMYEQDDIVAVFHTGMINETAVKFTDGWIFYSTFNDSAF